MTTSAWHKSACNLCYLNCGLEIEVRGTGQDARITRVRGDADNPRSRGYLCNKAQAVPAYVHHRDRLTTPLRRRADGGFDAIDWDTAFSEIGARLREIVARHGGQTLALYGGGGQGNHAGGAFANGFLRALGSRNVFNALAQEKTGDFWVNGHLFGAQTCHTGEDIEHCDLMLVLGANPWLAHGFTNARQQLNAIVKDPNRRLLVVDPRRSETAELADLHVAPRPGGDAYLLAALLATLVRQDCIDEEFLAEHCTDWEAVKAVLLEVPIARFARAADVPQETLKRMAQMIAESKAMVVRAELGIQHGLHSTLNSYLEKLLFLVTGNFGRKGTNLLHGWLQPLWGNGRGHRYAPNDTEIIAGLLPPNTLAEAIESDHPDALRVLWVDSGNPLNTVADTQRLEAALARLDLMVVVDVAFTESAARADYVLPAASQYEKCEYTLFNFEYPTNYLHVRRPVLPPLADTRAEPEIYRGLANALGLLPPADALARVAAVARDTPADFPAALEALQEEYPACAPATSLLLYATLGQCLPAGTAAAAPLWASSQRLASTRPAAVARALGASLDADPRVLGQQLFEAVVNSPSGAAISVDESVWDLIETADRRVHLAIPLLLDALRDLDPAAVEPRADFPFVLSAGQRRAQNVNQILRAPGFRKRDPDGALYIHPDDLADLRAGELGWVVVTSSRGELVARAQADDGLRRGYVVLPHGYGQAYPGADGERRVAGPRINHLTDAAWRDPIAGTPYHKHVPVRLRAADEAEAAAAEMNSRAIRAGAGQ
ncbi:MAG: molybdopterin-dependent oxidoreductase [Gammaproteobacteria bacterium]|nr:molybdopterin-dependent oxidoreductase [Gammaproteobacteria bacterium]